MFPLLSYLTVKIPIRPSRVCPSRFPSVNPVTYTLEFESQATASPSVMLPVTPNVLVHDLFPEESYFTIARSSSPVRTCPSKFPLVNPTAYTESSGAYAIAQPFVFAPAVPESRVQSLVPSGSNFVTNRSVIPPNVSPCKFPLVAPEA
ncbi:hypothetical protein CH375_12245 [Leptospira ellisii]|nr:hypothetical protein CH375_12245 [Leptospira ellisii]